MEGIRPICARTERVAVNVADGLSRVSGGRRIGVCAVQYGPGAENAFGAVAQAYSDGSPVLVLPGGLERGRQGVAPGFQAIHNYRSVATWVEVVNASARLPRMLRRAFTLLRNGRPGPVVLEVPTDAKLYIDDQLMKASTEVRRFNTPELEAGQTYYYILKAEVTREGSTRSEEKRVLIKAGEEIYHTKGTCEVCHRIGQKGTRAPDLAVPVTLIPAG